MRNHVSPTAAPANFSQNTLLPYLWKQTTRRRLYEEQGELVRLCHQVPYMDGLMSSKQRLNPTQMTIKLNVQHPNVLRNTSSSTRGSHICAVRTHFSMLSCMMKSSCYQNTRLVNVARTWQLAYLLFAAAVGNWFGSTSNVASSTWTRVKGELLGACTKRNWTHTDTLHNQKQCQMLH